MPAVRLRRQCRGRHHGLPEPLPTDGLPEPVVHDTGDTPTIATLVEWANGAALPQFEGRTVTAADTLKNVLLKVRRPGGDWELLAIGVPGDREVDDKRLGAELDPAEYAMLDDADFARYPFLKKAISGRKGCWPTAFATWSTLGGVGHSLDHWGRRARQARGGPGGGP